MKCSIILLIFVKTVASLYCYWNTGCPYKYFSTITPYNAIRGDIRDSVVKVKGCEPVSVWGIFRHGKKSPEPESANSMRDVIFIKNDIQSSYSNGNSSLCAQDVENLSNWLIDETLYQPHHLMDEGHDEMKGIGKRLQQAFPKLLKNLEGDSIIRSISGKWIENSVKAFESGFKDENLSYDIPKIEDDNLIDPYNLCDKYQKEVETNPNAFEELHKYYTNSDYSVLKDRIQRRTGLNITLSNDQIFALYDLCRYTWKGINTKASPWCAIFTTDDLKILEYVKDMDTYYRGGYGYPINEKLAYPILSDLFKSFQDAKEGKGNKIIANFGRNKILTMVYTALKLFRDENLLAGSKRDPERKWRTSKIAAFSTNFIAVLNRCSRTDSPDYNVVFYLNEEPLGSICEERICSWQEFEDMLTPFVNTTLDFCKLL